MAALLQRHELSRPHSRIRAALLIALLCCLSAASFCAALTTEVHAGETLELTETLPKGTEMHFQFALHPEYLMPISIKDRTTNEILKQWKDHQRGVFSLPAAADTRIIVISFDNSNTMFTSKNVNFDLRTPVDANYAVSATELDPIEQKIRVLSTTMQRLRSLQVSIAGQQKNHRATVEDANERVLMYSIFQVVAFLGISGFQLFMLKRFLEKKTYI